MNNISIEYAHIYTNAEFDSEQRTSIEILDQLKHQETQKGNLLSMVIMVDDYSFPDPTFDYGAFSEWLRHYGHMPDLIIRESMLIPQCDKVLAKITDETLKAEIVDYILTRKYPCSLFIATWYLIRLGIINADYFPKELTAGKLINILPESFIPFEEKGIAIIRATEHAIEIPKIENRYFEGRQVM